MASSNEPEGPSIISVAFIGLLIFILGGVLGLASLVSQPVLILNKEPEPDSIKPGTVFLIRGDNLGGNTWRSKEDAWKSSLVGELSLDEAELNKWSKSRLSFESDIPREERDSWRNRFKLEADPLNFRFSGRDVQISTQIRFLGALTNKTFHCIVYGRFKPGPDGVWFDPDRGTIGRAAIGHVPGLREWVFNYLSGLYVEAPDIGWLEESFANMESADLIDGQLILRRKTEG
jgi:hypothetical protein